MQEPHGGGRADKARCGRADQAGQRPAGWPEATSPLNLALGPARARRRGAVEPKGGAQPPAFFRCSQAICSALVSGTSLVYLGWLVQSTSEAAVKLHGFHRSPSAA